MIGEIITGGISLLGGLFGKKKKQETTSRVNYQQMVDDATAAGFNPLTAIRNGGSAGFTTTTSPTISNTPEVLSNLGGILGQALGDKLDPINAKKRELDTLLVDRQLRQLKQGPQTPASFKTPRTYSGTKVSQQLVPRVGPAATSKVASVPAAYNGGNPYGYEMNKAAKTDFGNQPFWQSNPWMPDASVVEDSNGEVAGIGYGLVKMAPDLGFNLGRWTLMGRDRYRKSRPAIERKQNIERGASAIGRMFMHAPKRVSGGGGW